MAEGHSKRISQRHLLHRQSISCDFLRGVHSVCWIWLSNKPLPNERVCDRTNASVNWVFCYNRGEELQSEDE